MLPVSWYGADAEELYRSYSVEVQLMESRVPVKVSCFYSWLCEAPLGDPLALSKPSNFMIFESFWVRWALGNMLISIVSNSYFGKRPGAREITTFGSIVSFMLPEMLNYMTLYNTI